MKGALEQLREQLGSHQACKPAHAGLHGARRIAAEANLAALPGAVQECAGTSVADEAPGGNGNGSAGAGEANGALPADPTGGRRTWKAWGAQKMQVWRGIWRGSCAVAAGGGGVVAGFLKANDCGVWCYASA